MLGGNCVGHASGHVSTCISATTLAVVSSYINDVKIIASLTFMRFQVLFYVTSTLALLAGILGNIIVLRDNVTIENGDVHKYISLLLSYSYVLLLST